MRTDFRPPHDNPFLIKAVYASLPVIMRARRVLKVGIPDADWEHLHGLRDGRLILSANHPTGTDPLIAMFLARRLGGHFNFVAARENFIGGYGWLIQRLGVYSIARGMPDRESIQTTRTLLAEHDRKVALFPEGETYYYNDITLPFHCGVTQMGFWALSDLQKQGKDPYLPIVPVAIKYRFLEDPCVEIQTRLYRLEDAVGLTPATEQTWYERLVAVGEKVVTAMEREYRLPPDDSMDLDGRITRIKEHILERVSAGLGEAPPGGPLPERMRWLFNAVRVYSNEFVDAASGYEQRLNHRRVEQARPLLSDLWRLHNAIAMTGHYVRDHPTSERFAEALSRLEVEVLGKAISWTPAEALVRIAEPIQLAEWAGRYKENRRTAVDQATRVLEERVSSLLRDLWSLGRDLPAEAGIVRQARDSPPLQASGIGGTLQKDGVDDTPKADSETPTTRHDVPP